MAPDAVEPDDGADRSVGLGRASGQPSEIQGVAETGRPREAAIDRGASARSHPPASGSSRPYRRTPGSGFIAGGLRRRLGPGNRTRHRIRCVDAVALIQHKWIPGIGLRHNIIGCQTTRPRPTLLGALPASVDLLVELVDYLGRPLMGGLIL